MSGDHFTEDFKTTPYWWDAAPPKALPERELPAKTDVLIVGGGFQGLSAALTLARSGRDVLVVDAETPGSVRARTMPMAHPFQKTAPVAAPSAEQRRTAGRGGRNRP